MIKHAICKLKHTYPFLDRLYVILTLPTGTLYFSSTCKEAKEKFVYKSIQYYFKKPNRNQNMGKNQKRIEKKKETYRL